ncbi:hypothetical protein ACXR0O_25105 [Verrucomicrobiota bacterium sgz303538]
MSAERSHHRAKQRGIAGMTDELPGERERGDTTTEPQEPDLSKDGVWNSPEQKNRRRSKGPEALLSQNRTALLNGLRMSGGQSWRESLPRRDRASAGRPLDEAG